MRRGRFDVRLARRDGPASEVVEQFNELVAVQERHSRDLLRISRVVGREGRMSDRLDEESYDGAWAGGVQAVNALIDDLAAPTAEIARVLDAVAEGDLSQHMALEIDGRRLRGEFRRIGRTVNRMVDQLSSFADEVTRVAREVGTEGKLGGQADVRGVAGTWRALDRLGQHDGEQPDQPGAFDLAWRPPRSPRVTCPARSPCRRGARSPSWPRRSTR